MIELYGFIREVSGNAYNKVFENANPNEPDYLISDKNNDIPESKLLLVKGNIIEREKGPTLDIVEWEEYMSLPSIGREPVYRLASFRILHPRNESPERTEREQSFIDRRTLQMIEFFRSCYRERITYEWETHVIYTDEFVGPPIWAKNSIRDFERNVGYNDPNFRPRFKHRVGGFNAGFRGHAAGTDSVTYGGADITTCYHELKHTAPPYDADYLIQHNSILYNNGRLDEYGGPTMLGKKIGCINTLEFDLMDMVPEHRRLINVTGEYKIAFHEIEETGLQDDEYQILTFQVLNDDDPIVGSRGWYAFGVDRGHGWLGRNNNRSCLQVYGRGNIKMRNNETQFTNLTTDPLYLGESRRFGDYSVMVTAVEEDGSVVVDVQRYGDSHRQPERNIRPRSYETLERVYEDNRSNNTITPEEINAILWNPDFNGQGWNFCTFGEDNKNIMAGWFTGDGLENPKWYTLHGNFVDDYHIRLEIYMTTGGTFEDPTKADNEKIGYGLIYKDYNDQLRFLLNTSEHGRDEIRVEKLTPDGTINPEHGVWFDPSRNGEGMFIWSADDRIIAFLYSYASENYVNYDEDNCHVRYMLELDRTTDTQWNGHVYSFNSSWLNPKSANIIDIGDCVLTRHVDSNGNESISFTMSIENDTYENTFIPLF